MDMLTMLKDGGTNEGDIVGMFRAYIASYGVFHDEWAIYDNHFCEFATAAMSCILPIPFSIPPKLSLSASLFCDRKLVFEAKKEFWGPVQAISFLFTRKAWQNTCVCPRRCDEVFFFLLFLLSGFVAFCLILCIFITLYWFRFDTKNLVFQDLMHGTPFC